MTTDHPAVLLRTPRLLLRPVGPADTGPLHAVWTAVGVRRFLWDGEVIPPERTRAIVETSVRQFATERHGLFGAWQGDELLGFGGLWYFRDPPELELLFGVREPDWGRGLATEIGAAIVRYGFAAPGMTRIRASADAGNHASHRVLGKLGFRPTGRRVVGGLETGFLETTESPPGRKERRAMTGTPVVTELSRLLATSYTLYLKTQNYHWNVTGPMFTTLHTLFELQYTELATAVDEIAERIRSLGAHAPGSLAAFSGLSAVREESGRPSATDMIRQLVEDQEAVGTVARAVFDAADEAGDQATADLATRRMEVHQKNAWMLRSHLE